MLQRQQIFNSLTLSLTAAVLVTQPAIANTIQISSVRLNPTANGIEVILETPKSGSPPVFTSSYDKTFVADIINTQMSLPPGGNFRQDNPAEGITAITVKPLNANSIRVEVTGKDTLPVAQVVGSKKGVILRLTTGDSKQVSAVQTERFDAISQPAPVRKLLSEPENIAKSPPVTTSRFNHSPTNSSDLEKKPAPDFLNQSPNPLQFPTKPEQVRIRRTEPITLQQALELGRRNNRDLQVTQLTLERSRSTLREARAALYPTLSANGGIDRQEGVSISNGRGTTTTTGTGTTGTTTTGTGTTGTTTTGTGTTGTTTTGTGTTGTTTTGTGTTGTTTTGTGTTGTTTTGTGTTTGTTTGGTTTTGVGTGTSSQVVSNSSQPFTFATGGLTLSYDLFTSGERAARIRSAEEQVRFNELDVERQIEELRLNVATDYYALQGADEQVRISESAVRNAQASLTDTINQERAGLGTRFDTLRAEVQLANARQDLTNARSQQRNARRQLVRRLNLAQAIDVTAADPVDTAGEWKRSLEESIVLAFQNRAELEQLLIQRNISEQNRRIALATLKPKVNVSASYNLQNVFQDYSGFGDGYRIGATVSLLLFDGGASRARAAQEEVNIAIAETRFADQRDQVRLQVEQAYATLESNRENILTARVALGQAREALNLARLRFQAGVGTQTEVINAEDALTRAEGNRVTAILNYNRSLINLQRSVSTGLAR